MSLLVDDLLLLARLDQGRPLAREPVDLCRGRRRRRGRDADQRRRTADHRSTWPGPSWSSRRRRPPAPDRGQPPAERRGAHARRARRSTWTCVATGSMAVVRVADEGPGLDAEQAARVFDRFYRGSEARTGEGTGTGPVDRGRAGRSPRRQRPGRERAGRGRGVHRRDPRRSTPKRPTASRAHRQRPAPDETDASPTPTRPVGGPGRRGRAPCALRSSLTAAGAPRSSSSTDNPASAATGTRSRSRLHRPPAAHRRPSRLRPQRRARPSASRATPSCWPTLVVEARRRAGHRGRPQLRRRGRPSSWRRAGPSSWRASSWWDRSAAPTA